MYVPKPLRRTNPELQDLYDFLEDELITISRSLQESNTLELRETSKAPVRPRTGMMVRADGTDWDPGDGAGTYYYNGSAWVKLGDATHVHTLADITDAGALAALDEVDVANIGPIATDRILGRDTAGNGDAEELTLSQVLDFIGSAARGDILKRGASTWERLAVGASGTVLKSDGTDPSWGTPTGGMTLISTQSPTSTTNATFQDIPATYKNLIFIGDRIDVTTDGGNITLRSFTSNTFTTGHAHSAASISVTTTTLSAATAGAVSTTAGAAIGTGSDAADTYFIVVIFDYTNTSRHKQFLSFCHDRKVNRTFAVVGGIIETTSALANIRIVAGSNYVSGTIDLYGW